MSLATEVILRSILFQAETAETLDDFKRTLRAMCSPETVAHVQKHAAAAISAKKAQQREIEG